MDYPNVDDEFKQLLADRYAQVKAEPDTAADHAALYEDAARAMREIVAEHIHSTTPRA